jgi:hypothetical protein
MALDLQKISQVAEAEQGVHGRVSKHGEPRVSNNPKGQSKVGEAWPSHSNGGKTK